MEQVKEKFDKLNLRRLREGKLKWFSILVALVIICFVIKIVFILFSHTLTKQTSELDIAMKNLDVCQSDRNRLYDSLNKTNCERESEIKRLNLLIEQLEKKLHTNTISPPTSVSSTQTDSSTTVSKSSQTETVTATAASEGEAATAAAGVTGVTVAAGTSVLIDAIAQTLETPKKYDNGHVCDCNQNNVYTFLFNFKLVTIF
jgi:hypothetical protein